MSSPSSGPRVFISYSHDSPEHALRVLALADALRDRGVDALIDQYESVPPMGWPRWMAAEIEKADFVLVVCSATYRRRFEGKEAPGTGKGVVWEGGLITTALYEAQGRQDKFLPVVFSAADLEYRPEILKATSYFLVEEPDPDGLDKLLRALARQSATPAPPLGEWRPLPPLARRSTFPVAKPATASAAIEQYRKWALEKYSRLELVGLGAADFRLSFDDIYVPLRAEHRFERMADGKGAHSFFRSSETLEVDRIFVGDRGRHALLLGEPGSGKTTALKKLHRLLLQSDPRTLGLEPGTLPVFLRLRRLTKDYFAQPLEAFLARELDELSNAELSPDLAAELWQGPLLLLLDGLDEIGDTAHRADVCRYLTAQLSRKENSRLRLLISCRRSGYSSELELAFASSLLEVKPLEPPQIALLVNAFFLEAGRLLGTHNPVEAKKAAAELVKGIDREERANARVRSMVSTPLLLTLLCVVVFRGNEIPRHRVTFYEQCLRILLGHWRKQVAAREPPVEVEQGLVLLEELAWELHRDEQREGLTPLVAAGLWGRLAPRQAFEVFHWLHQDAGILAFYAEHSWGFVHLGLQEYLTARWLAKRENELVPLFGRYADSWWQEVLLQLAALDRRSFALVVRGWIAAGVLREQADLLRQCLAEARDPDYEPFFEVLRQGSGAEQAAVLRLLRFRIFPELLAEAERLLAVVGTSAEVRSLAEELCRDSRVAGSGRKVDVAFLYEAGEEAAVRRISEALDRKSFTVFQQSPGKSWREEGLALLESRCALVLVVGESELSAACLKDVAQLWKLAQGADAFVLVLPESRPFAAEAFAGARRVQVGSLEQVDSLCEALCRKAAQNLPGRGYKVPGESWVEEVTGETFLWVPGGEFVVGSTAYGREQPPHRVRLSSYWLAQTPVTNRQYAIYLAQNPNQQQPQVWRESRYNAPEQPVVGLSWDEAVAYCVWLSKVGGLEVGLPTEAQWEFAARGGAEQREYPWGQEKPTATRACYGQDFQKGQPALVGSFPDGVARWGQLDLAGNVWEWCRDVWSENYSWCGLLEEDPCRQEDGSVRILRGGAFWLGAGSLRSACRGRLGSRSRRGGIGFRVAASPASLGP